MSHLLVTFDTKPGKTAGKKAEAQTATPPCPGGLQLTSVSLLCWVPRQSFWR